MTGRIRDEAIRAVRERASLSEVISDVVALRRRGRSAVASARSNAEKTPSFTVSEERGFFHCFGCGEHGDVFAFLMKAQALTFPEAVRRVAERFGVPLPEEAGEPARRREPLAAANAVARRSSKAELRAPAAAGRAAYLRERGLSEEVIERFGLGWAPARARRSRAICARRACRSRMRSPAGLVMRRDRPDGAGGVLDRFRIGSCSDHGRERQRRSPSAAASCRAAGERRSAAQVPQLRRVTGLPQGPHALRSRARARTPSARPTAPSWSRATST